MADGNRTPFWAPALPTNPHRILLLSRGAVIISYHIISYHIRISQSIIHTTYIHRRDMAPYTYMLADTIAFLSSPLHSPSMTTSYSIHIHTYIDMSPN